MIIAGLALGVFAPGGLAVAADSIDQTPVLRVLRLSDVPGAKNEELPSGALTASQFALSNDSTVAARHAEERILMHAGFRSAAIILFYERSATFLKSTAIELGSSTLAARALDAEARLAAHTQAPPHDTALVRTDSNFTRAMIVTFTPPTGGGAGGVEVLASAGNYIYTLQALQKPDSVSTGRIEGLLRIVMGRS
jgi:hypothetical protein